MRNIKLIVSYDGSRYAGWQRQKHAPTVQGVLEQSIAVMTREAVVLLGAGRTDAGVHALAMAANFKTKATIPCLGFLRGLNSILPDDVRVVSVSEMPDAFHARFDAIGKSYYYNFVAAAAILPTERLYNAHFPAPSLDVSAMSGALHMLEGVHDFSSFEKAGSRDLTRQGGIGAVREIFKASLIQFSDSPDHFRIVIEGSGFLRHMVRNIVGTVYEVGLGLRSAEDFRIILLGKNRSLAGRTAPAKGLFLREVFY